MTNANTYFALLQDNIGGISLVLSAKTDDEACAEALAQFEDSKGYKKVVVKSFAGIHTEKPEEDGNWINSFDKKGWMR